MEHCCPGQRACVSTTVLMLAAALALAIRALDMMRVRVGWACKQGKVLQIQQRVFVGLIVRAWWGGVCCQGLWEGACMDRLVWYRRQELGIVAAGFRALQLC